MLDRQSKYHLSLYILNALSEKHVMRSCTLELLKYNRRPIRNDFRSHAHYFGRLIAHPDNGVCASFFSFPDHTFHSDMPCFFHETCIIVNFTADQIFNTSTYIMSDIFGFDSAPLNQTLYFGYTLSWYIIRRHNKHTIPPPESIVCCLIKKALLLSSLGLFDHDSIAPEV